MHCLECGEEIGRERVCPYCGFEEYPALTPADYARARHFLEVISQPTVTPRKPKRKRFNNKEILALGLYPKKGHYKMSLISRILGK